LFVVSLSGTLPSLTTISSGGFGTSTRITPLLLPRTHKAFHDFAAFELHSEGTSAPAAPRFSTVTVSM